MTFAAESRHLLSIAVAAARQVEEPLKAAFRSEIGFGYKRDLHDIVTEHDKAAEGRIVSHILRQFPDSTILGEEGGTTGNGAVHWYVDPIDGTTNFACGIAHWCVSIAAAIDGQLVAGVILDPMAGDLFTGSIDGAFRNDVPLAARAADDETRAVLLTSFPNARHFRDIGNDALTAQTELFDRFLALRNLGSGALHLAHVVAGWADAVLGFSTNPWDVAAGILILERAGGRYVGLGKDGAPHESVTAPHYFAVGRGAQYPTLERIAKGMASAHTRDFNKPERALA
jgi:myo-inositol-1(or 4)-monophosphatase